MNIEGNKAGAGVTKDTPVTGQWARLRAISVSLGHGLSAEWVFTAVAFLIWLCVHGHYGITWDEAVQSKYGEAVRLFWSGHRSFQEFSHSAELPANIYFYGPALDLLCATIAHLFEADIFAVRHGVQGLLWVTMFYPVCALGKTLAGRLGAWCSGCALLGTPTLFGHAFNNPKDLPLACATIWLLHACVTVSSAQRLNWRDMLKLGGAAGFVLGVRPGAWFLFALMAVVPAVVGLQIARSPDAARTRGTVVRTLWVLAGAMVVGWIVMILPWPNAWHSPLLHPIRAAQLAMRFDEVYPVLFAGKIYDSNHLPWSYLASHVALSEPVPILLLAVWGHIVIWRRAFGSAQEKAAALGITFLLWFPMITFVVVRPNVYDGMRHFLFVLPPLALFSGVAAAGLIQRLQAVPKAVVLPGTVLLLLSAVPAMVRLHPYQNVYFNSLAGRRETLHQRYETDYWVSSYREAALWINKVQSNTNRQLSVAVAANSFCHYAFTHFIDKRVNVVGIEFGPHFNAQMPQEINYYVATVRHKQCNNFHNLPIEHRIEREGVLLTVIKRNDPMSAKSFDTTTNPVAWQMGAMRGR